MFFAEARVRVFIYGQPVDARKSYDGLYALARNEMKQDPVVPSPKRCTMPVSGRQPCAYF